MAHFKGFIAFLLLWGILLFTLSCGTARRVSSVKNQPESEHQADPEAVDLPPPAIIASSYEVKPKAKEIHAISHLELSSLQPIEKGRASWYGKKFDGRLTANGEAYDMYALTAAHRTLPFNTVVLVKNMDNNKTVVVRINDRGPYAKNRIIDLSKKAARKLGMIGTGTAHVRLYTLKDAVPQSSIANIKVPTYTIQLASYNDEAPAFEYAARVRGSRVEVAYIDDITVYRVYYGLYIDKQRANKVRKTLARRDIDGYVTQVENG